MGNIITNTDPFNQSEWQTTSKNPNYNILKNISNHIQVQQHHKFFPEEAEFLKQKNIYLKRQFQSKHNILRIEAVKEHIIKKLCSTTFQLTVYIEHPRLCFDKIEQIDFPLSLYATIQLLEASQYLLKIYPNFTIDESKIFISQKYKIKVWISNIASDNIPSDFQQFSGQQSGTQEEQVQRIVDIIQSRTLPQAVPLNFIKPLRFNSFNITDGLIFIRRYIVENKLEVPESFQNYFLKVDEEVSNDGLMVIGSSNCLVKQNDCKGVQNGRRYNHRILNCIVDEISSGRKGYRKYLKQRVSNI